MEKPFKTFDTIHESDSEAEQIGNMIVRFLNMQPDIRGLYITSNGPKTKKEVARMVDIIFKDPVLANEMYKII